MPNQVMYGFENLQSVFSQRVTEIGVDVVGRAIDDTLTEHNRQVNALLALFCSRTTEFKRRFYTAISARSQALDENGRARPIRAAGFYDVAFPIYMAGNAWGANWLTLQKMTVEEANDRIAALINGDLRWIRDHILAALYANNSWQFNDEEHGALTCVGLANGDSVKYQILTGADMPAQDTHYLAQAAAIADAANPFPVIFDEIMEHPENGGEVIALIPSNLRASVLGLATFKPLPDPNIAYGTGADTLSGGLGVEVPGTVIGYIQTAKVWVVEWRSQPSDYIIAVPTDGERPLRMREDVEGGLNGFQRVAERENHPWWEEQYVRRCGFAGWNRVGAAVYRIGNASYAVPTNYGMPMP